MSVAIKTIKRTDVKEEEEHDPEDEDGMDELDELLCLLDEEEKIEEKQKEIQQKQQQVEKEKKKQYESESFVCSSCKLRVDPLTRALSAESLDLRLRRWTVTSLIHLPSKLRNNANTNNKEYVIIGILAAKIIKHSKNNTKYLLIKMDDFQANIACFIFNTELIEKFYKIQIGTVLVIAQPQIINNNNNNNNNNKNNGNNFQNRKYKTNPNEINISLKIEKLDQILIVGKSIDFGFCNKLSNINGQETRCQNIVNKTRYDLCQFHAAQNYKKYASKRNDTNRSKLSSKIKSRNTKKSLSKITMTQMKRPQIKRSQTHSNITHKNNNLYLNHRKKNILHKNRNLLQIKKDEKKKEMNKMLKGKTLMPHLGTNWNQNNIHSKSKKDNFIILGPKPMRSPSMHLSQQRAKQVIGSKGITFSKPDPNNTNDLNKIQKNVKNKNHKKRSFQSMMSMNNMGNKENISPPRKRNRLSQIVKVKDCDMEEIQNKKSLNDTLRKDIERESMLNDLDALQKEEECHDQLEQVTSVQCNVYVCKYHGCPLKDKICEKPNSFCKSHQMNIIKSCGRKYFWKCDNCGTKTHSLNTKRVRNKCFKCGKRKFVPASAYNLSTPYINKSEQKLILVNNKK